VSQQNKKILVFEFITGGGFAQEELPDSLATEGLLMLKALLEELELISGIQLTALIDRRINVSELSTKCDYIAVEREQCIFQILPKLIEQTDLVWPIAPEMDGALEEITKIAEQKSKQVLNSSSVAIAICSDKLITTNQLKAQGIAVVDSVQLDEFKQQFSAPWVVKSKDGVGCLNSYFIENNRELDQINIQVKSKAHYLIQPYIEGEVLSLSCLFKEGKAWLLGCNKQDVEIDNGQFQLKACIVNISTKNHKIYQELIEQIANAIPGLFAYAGIDIIQVNDGSPLVLEINPRLTTSYVGINQAIGVNVAKTVIEMADTLPIIKKTQNQQVTVPII